MTGRFSKLIAILLVAIVVASGLGYWLLAPKMPSPIVTYTTQQTSLMSSFQTHAQSSTASSMVTSSTTLAETFEWINVSAAAVHPVSYYLKLLESNGTQPYVQLARDLRKLPDLTNATAVAKITYLALNATNPEVKEAFGLMIKGGTPNPNDFTYRVPKYNTELQVLYWLASENDFKKDDTLALAIAMVNGFWVTIGDEQVDKAVANDTSDLLQFFRETNELQRLRGYFELEKYPLEAKLCLAWTGGDPARGGRAHYQLMNGSWTGGDIAGGLAEKTLNVHHLITYEHSQMDLQGYRWNTVSVSTLRIMQAKMIEMRWIAQSATGTVKNIEEYFFFSGGADHWIFTQPNDSMIEFNGEQTINHNMNNPNLVFEHYLTTGKGLGVCGDEASLIESLSKSWGISTIRLTRTYATKGASNHDHIVYYDPPTRTWKCYEKQLDIGRSGTWNVYLFTPPVIQHNYFVYRSDTQQTWIRMPNVYYAMQGLAAESAADFFLKGVPTAEMKQWLLYS